MVEGTSIEGARGSAIAVRLADVRQRIGMAARRVGREEGAISLMAVSKGFPRETVQAALSTGLTLFGENRVQEAEEKFIELTAACELHLVGHLQRNKSRTAAATFSCVQSIERIETAAALDTRCAELGKVMDVLLEMNTSGEQSKSGFPTRDELLRGLDVIGRLSHLRVKGLMTVGPLCDDNGRIHAAFSLLRSLFDEIRSSGGSGFDTLSMGMSGDFETAIEEGSTLVRIGTALFGPRQKR